MLRHGFAIGDMVLWSVYTLECEGLESGALETCCSARVRLGEFWGALVRCKDAIGVLGDPCWRPLIIQRTVTCQMKTHLTHVEGVRVRFGIFLVRAPARAGAL